MNSKKTFFNYFCIGFALSLVVNFVVFVWSVSKYLRIDRWKGDISTLLIENLLVGFLYSFGASLMFAFFLSSSFSFSILTKDTIGLRKKVVMVFALFSVMFAFNNFIYPKLELIVLINFLKIASSDSETGKLSTYYFNTEEQLKEVKKDPRFSSLFEFNRQISHLKFMQEKKVQVVDSLLSLLPKKNAQFYYEDLTLEKIGVKYPIESQSEITDLEIRIIESQIISEVRDIEDNFQRHIRNEIEKNSYKVLQPFLIFIFLPLAYLIPSWSKFKSKISLFLVACGIYLLSTYLFRLSGKIADYEIWNINIGMALFIIIFTHIFCILAKAKYHETTRHKKWQAT